MRYGDQHDEQDTGAERTADPHSLARAYEIARSREDATYAQYRRIRASIEGQLNGRRRNRGADALDVLARSSTQKEAQRARRDLERLGVAPAVAGAYEDAATAWRGAGLMSVEAVDQVLRAQGRSNAVPEAYGGMAALRQELELVARRMNPHVGLEFAREIWGEGAGLQASGAAAGVDRMRVAGGYWRADALVRVALDPARYDVLDTTYHELWHSLEQLMTPAEQRVMAAELPAGDTMISRRDMARALEAAGIGREEHGAAMKAVFGRAGALPRDAAVTAIGRRLTPEKAAAVIARIPDRSTLVHRERIAYAFGQWAAARHRGQQGQEPKGPAARVGKFLMRVANWLDGNGFQTAEDVFQKAYRGDFAKRVGDLVQRDPAAYRDLRFLAGDDAEFRRIMTGAPVPAGTDGAGSRMAGAYALGPSGAPATEGPAALLDPDRMASLATIAQQTGTPVRVALDSYRTLVGEAFEAAGRAVPRYQVAGVEMALSSQEGPIGLFGLSRGDERRVVAMDFAREDGRLLGMRDVDPASSSADRPLYRVPQAGEAAEKPDEPASDRPLTSDHRIGNEARLGAVSPDTRLKRLGETLDTLEALELARRRPTHDEADRLASYPGVGGLPHLFENGPAGQSAAVQRTSARLEESLGEDGVLDLRRAVLNSHYTDPRLIREVWAALGAAGLADDPAPRILEPGAGAGWWIGLRPDWLDASRIWPVEVDPIASKVLATLYPSAQLQAEGFERLDLPEGFFTAAVGNVPYGRYSVYEEGYGGLSIHDHFLAKSLDLVAPGGIVAALTSRYTLDSEDSTARDRLRDSGELLAAIRLPSGALARAGTDVVADLIVLRKRPVPLSRMAEAYAEAIQKNEPDWSRLREVPDPLGGPAMRVNAWFADRPDMVIGRLERSDTHFVEKDGIKGIGVEFYDGAGQPVGGEAARDLVAVRVGELLGKALPAGSYRPLTEERKEAARAAAAGLEQGRYLLVEGVLHQRIGRESAPASLPAKAEAVIRDAIGLDAALKEVLRLQREGAGEAAKDAARTRLGAAHDAFVETHGPLRAKANARILAQDPALSQLSGLERPGRDGGRADVFMRDVVAAVADPSMAATPEEALAISLDRRGRADAEYIGALLGQSADEASAALLDAGLAYRDPVTRGLVERDRYLSGDVVTKLEAAREAAAADQAYASNVAALEPVQPPRIPHTDIAARLGAPWQDVDTIRRFLAEQVVGEDAIDGISVAFTAVDGAWRMGSTTAARKDQGVADWAIHNPETGASRRGMDVIEDALNGRLPTVTYTVGEDKDARTVVDMDATMAARAKVKDIQRRFTTWLWTDPDRIERLTDAYNARYNRWVEPSPGGQHLTLPGASPERVMRLRPTQRNAIWRALTNSTMGVFHEVGAGKTDIQIAAAIEAKRMGLASKPLLAVQASTLGQIAEDARSFYPQARILVWPEGDVSPVQRRQFWGTVKAGDWDLVIVPHDPLEALPLTPAVEARFLREEAADYKEALAAIEASSTDEKSRPKVKRFETMAANLEAKAAQLLKSGRVKDAVYFNDLGVDWLDVDEAHRLKNLYAPTSMENVKGLPSGESQRASRVYAQARWLQESGGRFVPATGTPVTNSLAECYTWQRFLQKDMLDRAGIRSFDAWARNFAEVEDRIELDVAGQPRVTTRLSRYVNVPELQHMLRQSGDIVLADQVPGLKRPKAVAQAVVVPATAEQLAGMQELASRAEKIRKREVDPSEDNLLKVATDGRKLALDPRLLDDAAEAGGKIGDVASKIAQIAAENPGTTQLAFFDFGVHEVKDSSFIFRDALKRELMDRGIPGEQILDFWDLKAAGPDALEAGKQALRDGKAAVGIGSTATMGTGVNVQDRLIALHNLDAPWLLADILQRDGRGVRPGNRNEDVWLYRYVTEGTFDAFSWQLLAAKERFIQQFLRGDAVARTVEGDVDEVSAAELAALAAGNPLLLAQARLSAEVQTLEAEAAGLGRVRQDLLRRASEAEGQAAVLEREARLLDPAVGAAFRALSAMTGDGEAGLKLLILAPERIAEGLRPEEIAAAAEGPAVASEGTSLAVGDEIGGTLRRIKSAEGREVQRRIKAGQSTSGGWRDNVAHQTRPQRTVALLLGGDGKPTGFQIVLPARSSAYDGSAPLTLRGPGGIDRKLPMPGADALVSAAIKGMLVNITEEADLKRNSAHDLTERAGMYRARAAEMVLGAKEQQLAEKRRMLKRIEARLSLPEADPARLERIKDGDGIDAEQALKRLDAALERLEVARLADGEALKSAEAEAALWSAVASAAEARAARALQETAGPVRLPSGVDLTAARDSASAAAPMKSGETSLDLLASLIHGETVTLAAAQLNELLTEVADLPPASAGGSRILVQSGPGDGAGWRLVDLPAEAAINKAAGDRWMKEAGLAAHPQHPGALRELDAIRRGSWLVHPCGQSSDAWQLVHAPTGQPMGQPHRTMEQAKRAAAMLDHLPVDWAAARTIPPAVDLVPAHLSTWLDVAQRLAGSGDGVSRFAEQVSQAAKQALPVAQFSISLDEASGFSARRAAPAPEQPAPLGENVSRNVELLLEGWRLTDPNHSLLEGIRRSLAYRTDGALDGRTLVHEGSYWRPASIRVADNSERPAASATGVWQQGRVWAQYGTSPDLAVEIPALVNGTFAVHPSLDHEPGEGWRVTHLPTGLSIGRPPYGDRDSAMALAESMLSLPFEWAGMELPAQSGHDRQLVDGRVLQDAAAPLIEAARDGMLGPETVREQRSADGLLRCASLSVDPDLVGIAAADGLPWTSLIAGQVSSWPVIDAGGGYAALPLERLFDAEMMARRVQALGHEVWVVQPETLSAGLRDGVERTGIVVAPGPVESGLSAVRAAMEQEAGRFTETISVYRPDVYGLIEGGAAEVLPLAEFVVELPKGTAGAEMPVHAWLRPERGRGREVLFTIPMGEPHGAGAFPIAASGGFAVADLPPGSGQPGHPLVPQLLSELAARVAEEAATVRADLGHRSPDPVVLAGLAQNEPDAERRQFLYGRAAQLSRGDAREPLFRRLAEDAVSVMPRDVVGPVYSSRNVAVARAALDLVAPERARPLSHVTDRATAGGWRTQAALDVARERAVAAGEAIRALELATRDASRTSLSAQEAVDRMREAGTDPARPFSAAQRTRVARPERRRERGQYAAQFSAIPSWSGAWPYAAGTGPGAARSAEPPAPSVLDRVVARSGVDLSSLRGASELRQEMEQLARALAGDAEPPRGLLFAGPSGTGKTLAMEVLAGLVPDVPVLATSGTRLESSFIGGSAEAIHKAFAEARRAADRAGTAVLFIDEIDAVGARGQDRGGGERHTREMVNAMLEEMDGVRARRAGGRLVVVGATNRPEDIDPALRRTGRFDVTLTTALPDRDGRKDILVGALGDDSIRLGTWAAGLAERSGGASPAELEGTVREGRRLAALEGAELAERHLDLAERRVKPGVPLLPPDREALVSVLSRTLRSGPDGAVTPDSREAASRQARRAVMAGVPGTKVFEPGAASGPLSEKKLQEVEKAVQTLMGDAAKAPSAAQYSTGELPRMKRVDMRAAAGSAGGDWEEIIGAFQQAMHRAERAEREYAAAIAAGIERPEPRDQGMLQRAMEPIAAAIRGVDLGREETRDRQAFERVLGVAAKDAGVHKREIFKDFTEVAHRGFTGGVYPPGSERWAESERAYMDVQRRWYDHPTVSLALNKLSGIAGAAVHSRPDRDFLGPIARDLKLLSSEEMRASGPETVNDLMSRMMLSPEEVKQTIEGQGAVNLLDPNAMSGERMLMAAERVREAGYDPAKHLHVEAWNQNPLLHRIAHIQATWAGIPATLVEGDVLTGDARNRVMTATTTHTPGLLRYSPESREWLTAQEQANAFKEQLRQKDGDRGRARGQYSVGEDGARIPGDARSDMEIMADLLADPLLSPEAKARLGEAFLRENEPPPTTAQIYAHLDIVDRMIVKEDPSDLQRAVDQAAAPGVLPLDTLAAPKVLHDALRLLDGMVEQSDGLPMGLALGGRQGFQTAADLYGALTRLAVADERTARGRRAAVARVDMPEFWAGDSGSMARDLRSMLDEHRDGPAVAAAGGPEMARRMLDQLAVAVESLAPNSATAMSPDRPSLLEAAQMAADRRVSLDDARRAAHGAVSRAGDPARLPGDGMRLMGALSAARLLDERLEDEIRAGEKFGASHQAEWARETRRALDENRLADALGAYRERLGLPTSGSLEAVSEQVSAAARAQRERARGQYSTVLGIEMPGRHPALLAGEGDWAAARAAVPAWLGRPLTGAEETYLGAPVVVHDTPWAAEVGKMLAAGPMAAALLAARMEAIPDLRGRARIEWPVTAAERWAAAWPLYLEGHRDQRFSVAAMPALAQAMARAADLPDAPAAWGDMAKAMPGFDLSRDIVSPEFLADLDQRIAAARVAPGDKPGFSRPGPGLRRASMLDAGQFSAGLEFRMEQPQWLGPALESPAARYALAAGDTDMLARILADAHHRSSGIPESSIIVPAHTALSGGPERQEGGAAIGAGLRAGTSGVALTVIAASVLGDDRTGPHLVAALERMDADLGTRFAPWAAELRPDLLDLRDRMNAALETAGLSADQAAATAGSLWHQVIDDPMRIEKIAAHAADGLQSNGYDFWSGPAAAFTAAGSEQDLLTGIRISHFPQSADWQRLMESAAPADGWWDRLAVSLGRLADRIGESIRGAGEAAGDLFSQFDAFMIGEARTSLHGTADMLWGQAVEAGSQLASLAQVLPLFKADEAVQAEALGGMERRIRDALDAGPAGAADSLQPLARPTVAGTALAVAAATPGERLAEVTLRPLADAVRTAVLATADKALGRVRANEILFGAETWRTAPWRMTGAEFVLATAGRESEDLRRLGMGVTWQNGTWMPSADAAADGFREAVHQAAVASAVERALPVPPEVLDAAGPILPALLDARGLAERAGFDALSGRVAAPPPQWAADNSEARQKQLEEAPALDLQSRLIIAGPQAEKAARALAMSISGRAEAVRDPALAGAWRVSIPTGVDLPAMRETARAMPGVEWVAAHAEHDGIVVSATGVASRTPEARLFRIVDTAVGPGLRAVVGKPGRRGISWPAGPGRYLIEGAGSNRTLSGIFTVDAKGGIRGGMAPAAAGQFSTGLVSVDRAFQVGHVREAVAEWEAARGGWTQDLAPGPNEAAYRRIASIVGEGEEIRQRGWRAADVAVRIGDGYGDIGLVRIPGLVLPGLPIALVPAGLPTEVIGRRADGSQPAMTRAAVDASKAGPEDVTWALVHVQSGLVIRQDARGNAGDFQLPDVAARAAEAVAETADWSNLADLATQPLSVRNAILVKAKLALAPYINEDVEAWAEQRRKLHSDREMIARGFDVGQVYWTRGDMEAPAIDRRQNMIYLHAAKDAAEETFYDDGIIPVVARIGDGAVADITKKPEELSPHVKGILLAFWEAGDNANFIRSNIVEWEAESYSYNIEELVERVANHDEIITPWLERRGFDRDALDEDHDQYLNLIKAAQEDKWELLDEVTSVTFDFEDFLQYIADGNWSDLSGNYGGDLLDTVLLSFQEEGYEAVTYSEQNYLTEVTAVFDPYLVEPYWPELDRQMPGHLAEVAAAKEKRDNWAASKSEAEVENLRARVRDEIANFNIEELAKDGFETRRHLWTAVPNRDLPELDRAVIPGVGLIITERLEAALADAPPGWEALPVYLNPGTSRDLSGLSDIPPDRWPGDLGRVAEALHEASIIFAGGPAGGEPHAVAGFTRLVLDPRNPGDEPMRLFVDRLKEKRWTASAAGDALHLDSLVLPGGRVLVLSENRHALTTDLRVAWDAGDSSGMRRTYGHDANGKAVGTDVNGRLSLGLAKRMAEHGIAVPAAHQITGRRSAAIGQIDLARLPGSKIEELFALPGSGEDRPAATVAMDRREEVEALVAAVSPPDVRVPIIWQTTEAGLVVGPQAGGKVWRAFDEDARIIAGAAGNIGDLLEMGDFAELVLTAAEVGQLRKAAADGGLTVAIADLLGDGALQVRVGGEAIVLEPGQTADAWLASRSNVEARSPQRNPGASSEAKERFLATMSHDLRAVDAGVLAATQAIEAGQDPGDWAISAMATVLERDARTAAARINRGETVALWGPAADGSQPDHVVFAGGFADRIRAIAPELARRPGADRYGAGLLAIAEPEMAALAGSLARTGIKLLVTDDPANRASWIPVQAQPSNREPVQQAQSSTRPAGAEGMTAPAQPETSAPENSPSASTAPQTAAPSVSDIVAKALEIGQRGLTGPEPSIAGLILREANRPRLLLAGEAAKKVHRLVPDLALRSHARTHGRDTLLIADGPDLERAGEAVSRAGMAMIADGGNGNPIRLVEAALQPAAQEVPATAVAQPREPHPQEAPQTVNVPHSAAADNGPTVVPFTPVRVGQPGTDPSTATPWQPAPASSPAQPPSTAQPLEWVPLMQAGDTRQYRPSDMGSNSRGNSMPIDLTAGQAPELALRLGDLTDRLDAGGAPVETARSMGLLNDTLLSEMPAETRDGLLPLSPGYVAFKDAGRWGVASINDFLDSAGPDGYLAGRFPPAALDQLADYGGRHVDEVDAAFPDRVRAVRDDIVAVARQVNPSVEVHLTSRLYGVEDVVVGGAQPGGRKPLLGLYFAHHNAIAVSTDLSRGDPLATAYHELYHSVESLLKPQEKAALEKRFGPPGPNGFNEQAAEAFGLWAAEKFKASREGRKATGLPESGLFRPVLRIAEKISNAFQGHGFKSWDSVFEQVLSGSVASRSKVFDVTAKIDADDAARIAEKAGLPKLAKQYRDVAAYDTSLVGKAAKAIGLKGKGAGKEPQLHGQQVVAAIRRYVDERTIRNAIRDSGYDVIKDQARITPLLADRDKELAADLKGSSAATPVHAGGPRYQASNPVPPIAARGGQAGPGPVAAERVRQPWELRVGQFTQDIGLDRETSKDQYQRPISRDVLIWPASEPKTPYRVYVDQFKGDTNKARIELHRLIVSDALARGRLVPLAVADDHPALKAAIQANFDRKIASGPVLRPPGEVHYEPGVPGLSPTRTVGIGPRGGDGAGLPEAHRVRSGLTAPDGFGVPPAPVMDDRAMDDRNGGGPYGPALDQRLRNAIAARAQDRIYLDVPEEQRRHALASGALPDVRTGLLYVPEETPLHAKTALLRAWPDWHSAAALRDYRSVLPHRSQEAAENGLRFDPLLEAWYAPRDLPPDRAAALSQRFPPLDPSAGPTPQQAVQAARAGVLYSIGTESAERRGMVLAGPAPSAQEAMRPRTVAVSIDPTATAGGRVVDFAGQVGGGAALDRVDSTGNTATFNARTDQEAGLLHQRIREHTATMGSAVSPSTNPGAKTAGAGPGPAAPAAAPIAPLQPFYVAGSREDVAAAKRQVAGWTPDMRNARAILNQTLINQLRNDPASSQAVQELTRGRRILKGETRQKTRNGGGMDR